ncbi:hypothetical protein S83_029349, partial [Arachis hypogaea]
DSPPPPPPPIAILLCGLWLCLRLRGSSVTGPPQFTAYDCRHPPTHQYSVLLSLRRQPSHPLA